MTRDELKDLVKECLLEIIVEGSPQRVVESLSERKAQKQQARPAARPALDLIHPRGKAPASRPTTQRPPERPRATPGDFKGLAGGNEIMASVFADTASSGLVERLGSPDGGGPSMMESSNPIVDTGIDPTMFEGASNWATMAFSETRNSSRR